MEIERSTKPAEQAQQNPDGTNSNLGAEDVLADSVANVAAVTEKVSSALLSTKAIIAIVCGVLLISAVAAFWSQISGTFSPNDDAPDIGEELDYTLEMVAPPQEEIPESDIDSIDDTEEELEVDERMMNVPDYIWIQGVQISTSLTELFLTSDTIYLYYRNVSEYAGVYEIVMTDEDMGPLAYMVNLQRLELYNQQISDLTPLAGLTNLQNLSVASVIWDSGPTLHEGGQISDISPLAGLTNLRFLSVEANQISDVSQLAGLTNLVTLDLRSNNISDISGLARLTNLISLGLSHNQISDITPLEGLMSLGNIDLSSNQISDITPLAGLTSLVHIGLGDNQISDITPLAGLTNLSGLLLHTNRISDITPLAGLTNLTALWLFTNQISDISPLAGLTELRHLWLNGNPVTDWSPVAHVDNVGGRP